MIFMVAVTIIPAIVLIFPFLFIAISMSCQVVYVALSANGVCFYMFLIRVRINKKLLTVQTQVLHEPEGL
jgi:hypothetical protein